MTKKKKKRKLSSRLSRHRGYGLIVCFLKEHGPARWSELHRHITRTLGVDTRYERVRNWRYYRASRNGLDTGKMKEFHYFRKGRGFYGGYFSGKGMYNSGKELGVYYKRRSNGKGFRYHLTPRGEEMYEFLQDRAAKGLDPGPAAIAKIWEAKKGDVFKIGLKNAPRKAYLRGSPAIILNDKHDIKVSGVGFQLESVNLGHGSKPNVWFPLDEGDVITFDRCIKGAYVFTTQKGREFVVDDFIARQFVRPR